MVLERISGLLAALWLPLSAGVYLLMQSGFRPVEAALLAVWVALPLPVAYFAARRVARTPNVWRVFLVALVAAFDSAPGSTGMPSLDPAVAPRACRA